MLALVLSVDAVVVVVVVVGGGGGGVVVVGVSIAVITTSLL